MKNRYASASRLFMSLWALAWFSSPAAAQQPDPALLAKINAIRKENRALQSDTSLRFHSVDNDQLIAFSKMSEDRSNVIVVVANLDPHHKQSGWVDLPLDYFHIDLHQEYQMHDLVTEDRYLWQGPRNYVELDPQRMPAHIFRLRRRVRSEHDFDYFL